MIDPLLYRVASVSLGALFLVSAGSKLAAPRRFAATVDSYMLIPLWLVGPSAVILIGLELLAGLLLVGEHGLRLGGTGAAIASGLLGCYAVAIAVNVRRGRTSLGCGCSGIGKPDAPIGWDMVTRNIALSALALILFIYGPSKRAMQASDYIAELLAILSLGLLYASFSQFQLNRALLQRSPR